MTLATLELAPTAAQSFDRPDRATGDLGGSIGTMIMSVGEPEEEKTEFDDFDENDFDDDFDDDFEEEVEDDEFENTDPFEAPE